MHGSDITDICIRTKYSGHHETIVAVQRRELLIRFVLAGSLPGFVGCLGLESEFSERTTSPSSPTKKSNYNAEDVLPKPPDGWQLQRKSGRDWRMLGGQTGVIGHYIDSQQITFEVVVMETISGFSAADKAKGWACVGWDVVLAYDGFVFAAGTGTNQPEKTYTPEEPPHMTRTPIPGTAEDSKKLLTFSPILTLEIVTGNEYQCDE